MIVEVIGWHGENEPQSRLYDLPEQIATAMEMFLSAGQVDGEMAAYLENLRLHDYDILARTPISELDRYYRKRLMGKYIWERFTHLQVSPELTLDFPLR